MTDEFDDSSENEIDDNCPFCPIEDECEKHLLAFFATTEGKINGGELRKCEAEIDRLLLQTLKQKTAEDLPYPLSDIIERIAENIDDDYSSEDAYWEHYSEVISALREYFSNDSNAEEPVRYEVEEGSGLWGYELIWALDPKSIADEFMTKLRAAVAG